MSYILTFSISLGIEVGFALGAYSVFESEGEISVKVVLDRPSVPSFPIPISIEATSHDAGNHIAYSPKFSFIDLYIHYYMILYIPQQMS